MYNLHYFHLIYKVVLVSRFPSQGTKTLSLRRYSKHGFDGVSGNKQICVNESQDRQQTVDMSFTKYQVKTDGIPVLIAKC